AARSVGIDCLVRIPENNSTLISQTLDDGADGIIISHIETAEEAVKMVQAAKYYPQGTRSIAQTNRATSYKIVDQSEYICLANAETIVVVLIESQTGMNNLEKILKVSGLDAVLLGQRDLAQSLGLADDIQNPLIIENFQKMIKLSRNAGLSAMVSVSFAKEAVPFIELGARLIIIGKDMRFLYRVYEKELQNTKDYDRNR
ncbi:MAG: aldolase/citrate lyase family protein, partial [Actinobacteria bacterium]|nr:aldolase/citrate lyase family protein [Actinomycetota bacterium]